MASILSNAVSSATAAAHSAAVSLASAKQLTVGSAIPSVEIKVDSVEGKIDLSKIPGRIVIVTVPAAFSPSCSDQVPAYIKQESAFKTKGIQGIYVVSVNDIFAMNAWKKKLAGDEQTGVRFLADDAGAFSAGAGLLFDAQAFLGGPRASRSAIVALDGKVEQIFIEKEPPQVTVSSADSVLAKL